MTMIRWRFEDNADSPSRAFKLDETKSWKNKLVRGHDIAEMIAQEVWDTESITINHLFITDPAPYRGQYTIVSKFIPEFTAKKMLSESEKPPVSRPKTAKKH